MFLLKIVSLMLMCIIRAEGQSAGCMKALGVESGTISNAKVVASSMWDSNHAPGQGRLNFHETTKYSGAWAAKTNDANQWLQIDLTSSFTKVTRVATQGRNQNAQWPWGTHHQWVTKYKLMYSVDGSNFQFYKEQGQARAKDFVGNTDRDTVVTHHLNPPLSARYIRFVPTAWHGHISMRVELYGCPLDNEPPVFTFCPSDISILDATEIKLRINWPSARATDNSGVAPHIVSSIQSGASFDVPGSYEVVYTAKDNNGNEARCSFQITLKRKSCQLDPPPKNGALACMNIGSEKSCAVMCQNKFDFKYNPAFIYYCIGGAWKEFSVFPYEKRPSEQWPDCSNPSNQSIMKRHNLPYFYFHGDANDPNVQSQIRNNFYNLASSRFVPPLFCKFQPQCKKENVAVYAGEAA